MEPFKSILVATDTRLTQNAVLERAAEVARQSSAALKIVDVVPEFSWTVRLTLNDHAHLRELIAQEKAKQLERLAEPLRASGLAVETSVLMGKTSVEIIREVLRNRHDLVMRVAKGRDSRSTGFFGDTGVRLLRQCPCPVWLVTSGSIPPLKHVVGCVDTSTGEPLDAELNDKVYELGSRIASYQGAQFSIVHAWSIWNEQMIKSRMGPDDFAALEQANQDQVAQLLDKFLASRGSSIREQNVHLLRGETPEVIARFIAQEEVDLVVMGTVARSGLAGILMGNTAEQILNGLQCSVLALKPDSFVCPIREA